MTRELLVYRLLTLHNVTFYQGLMADVRRAIVEGAFEAFRARFLARYGVESVDGSTNGPASREG